MASNLTVNVHVNEDTPITHVVHQRGEFCDTFASVNVGDASLLLDLDDIDRLTAELRATRDDLAALSKAAA
ncbi:hypothetical protein [Jiangella rhizosphaerae]|uniref:hypothetical protein n=1 Tax=Jiangella rhizosphaerae TaxID=2293569 RepID=UPI0013146353|nr:hypothetical protein [Jiangella rhizosphaerae]